MGEMIDATIVQTRTKRVLLIEDEDNLAMAIGQVITRDGHSCDRLRSTDSTTDRVRDDRPDLLLVDAATAGSPAFSLCQAVRRDPNLSSVKILVLHGSGKPIDRRRGAALGADGFLAKPFDLGELTGEVRRLLLTD